MTNWLVSWRPGVPASWLPFAPDFACLSLIPPWEATGELSPFTPTRRDQGEAGRYRVLWYGRDKDPQRQGQRLCGWGGCGGIAHPRGTHSGEVSRSQHRPLGGLETSPALWQDLSDLGQIMSLSEPENEVSQGDKRVHQPGILPAARIPSPPGNSLLPPFLLHRTGREHAGDRRRWGAGSSGCVG